MWVGYVRVSDVGERGGDSFRSPDDQAAAIRRWADARGVTVDVLAPELDESGGRADRPILMQALEGISAGRYEGIVALNQSRLMRDTAHLLVMVDAVRKAGGEVEVVEGRVDWETPEGRMMGTIIAAIDEQQRRGKSRDFDHHRRSSVERGIWKFRQTPIGYDRDPETRRLVPNGDAPKVKAAFRARKGGKASVSQIAVDLGMTPSGARAVLRNRVYLGEIRVGPHVNPKAHPALVDLATFEAVQALRQTRPARGPGPISMLAGLVRCASCGHMMRRGQGGGRRAVYSCHGKHSAGRCPSPSAITGPKIERYVADRAREFVADLRISTGRRSDTGDKLRADLNAAKHELAAYLAGTSAAGLPIESYAEGARQRQDAIDAAQAALDQHHTLAPLGGLFESGADFWDDLDAHERNQLLRGFLDAVVVRSAGRGKNLAVAERVRLFEIGTLPDLTYRGGGEAMPIRALPFPDLDDERLLGVSSFEDRLRDARG